MTKPGVYAAVRAASELLRQRVEGRRPCRESRMGVTSANAAATLDRWAERSSITRREWLLRAACAGVAIGPGWRLLSQEVNAQSQPSELTVTELGERLAVIEGAGANVTVYSGDEGLLLVDSGSPERTDELLRLLETRWPDKSVREVFNTNWGLEHTGANAALRSAGARIHAHENTKLWMGARFEVEWQDLRHEPRPAEELPNRTFYESGSIELGGAEVRYGHVRRAHTDGDIYVYFADANVLAVSDLLAVGGYPIVDYETGGGIEGMVGATRELLDIADENTVIVPAHGSIQTRAALEEQLALCEAVRTQVTATYRAGGTLADFVAANPTAPFADGRGDPALFLYLVYEGAYYN